MTSTRLDKSISKKDASIPHSMIIAVSLVSDHDEHLLMFSQDFSNRLHLPLKLVHACEGEGVVRSSLDWLEHLLKRTLSGDASAKIMSKAEQTLNEINRRLYLKTCSGKAAEERGKSCLLNPPQAAEVRCERPAGRAIAIAAKESRAALVVVGAREPTLWFNWQASTVKQLMVEAPCPVLVLRRDLSIDASRERFRIVLADDLTDASNSAVKVAFNMANRIEGVSLLHVHVASAKEAGVNLPKLEEEMITRTKPLLTSFETNKGHYKAIATKGDVLEEIIKIITENDADILIAGSPRKELREVKKISSGKSTIPLPPFKLLTVPCALVAVPEGAQSLF